MPKEIELAKQVLIDDLSHHSSSLSDPIGDARTYNKLLDYIFLSIEEGLKKDQIIDWLYELYKDQTDAQKYKFSFQIDLLVRALIAYRTYIHKNK